MTQLISILLILTIILGTGFSLTTIPNEEELTKFILFSKTDYSNKKTTVTIYLQSPVDTTVQAYDIYYTVNGEEDHVQVIANPEKYIDLKMGEKKIVIKLVFDGRVRFRLNEKSNIAISGTPESPAIVIK